MGVIVSKYLVTENGDIYFSIAGSMSDGFMVSHFKKLGWDSVTTLHKTDVFTLNGLIEFLSNPDNHMLGAPIGDLDGGTE